MAQRQVFVPYLVQKGSHGALGKRREMRYAVPQVITCTFHSSCTIANSTLRLLIYFDLRGYSFCILRSAIFPSITPTRAVLEVVIRG
jgi:hypothetical protein